MREKRLTKKTALPKSRSWKGGRRVKAAKTALGLAAAVGMLLFSGREAQASVMPYDTYSYDWWGEDVLQPHAYLYQESYAGNRFGTELKTPQDLFFRDGLLYIADTGNNRILILTEQGEYADEIAGGLSGPQGVFVTEEGHVYVADSGNGRIVEYDERKAVVREIGRPQTELIDASQNYVPTRVVVDQAGRMYVIAYGINMGLVEFNEFGEFQGFMGATPVTVSPFEYMWKTYFSTDAQKQRMETIIPTEYSNIYVDKTSFVYATISNLSEEDHLNGADAVRRLNPTGTDVLRRLGNYDIIGDLYSASDEASWSSFTDIAATDYGCYFVLDNAGGKVFCYDYDGNSLFIFGGTGSRSGMLRNPTSLALNDDQSRIYILDAQLGSILRFDITEYGTSLLGAMKAHYTGNTEESDRLWKEVLRENANSEVAYIGMGKIAMREGDYKQAMDYFKLGNSRKYYTRAFEFYRKELMQTSFARYMGVAIVLIVIGLLAVVGGKIKRWVGEVKCRNI
ncbi:MAG: 6-bladed beta-propeller [bacterium]|nr:6-bladed beta-propeller [bacterium]